ncbi:F0F1 ATP synthase subunit B [Bacteroidota bacterium]
MELITPDIGLLFWMFVSFLTVFLILKKFAWPAILNALKLREASISESLLSAKKAREEKERLEAEYEKIIARAKTERDTVMAEAREMKEKIILEAKYKANAEADSIIKQAQITIENEKAAAINDLINQVADISVGIAEKILKNQLVDPKNQRKLIENYMKDVDIN